MATGEETGNKAVFRRFHDAVNTGDEETISATIDEIVEPEVQIRTPLPVDATGAAALKEAMAMLRRAFPDLHVAVEDLIADGFDPAFVTKIAKMVQTSHYKRRLPLIAKLSYRTIGRDFLYARDWGT